MFPTEPARARLSLIAALADNRVIGVGNRLPWKLPADLQYFKRVTMGKPILMGRRTYASIGRALPGRLNVVVTRDPGFSAPDCVVAHSIEQALRHLESAEEIMVIGGAELYRQLLPKADCLYLTFVHQTFDGDAWFPEIDFNQWREVRRTDHEPDEHNAVSYSFVVYERAR